MPHVRVRKRCVDLERLERPGPGISIVSARRWPETSGLSTYSGNADPEPHFYVGHTSNVNGRLADHNAGRCPTWSPDDRGRSCEISRRLVDAVLAEYPAATDAEVSIAGPRMNGDFQIIAPSILTARAASNVADVYMYPFSRVAPSTRSTWGVSGTCYRSRIRLRQHEWGRLATRPRSIARCQGAMADGVGAVREDGESKRRRASAMACVPRS